MRTGRGPEPGVEIVQEERQEEIEHEDGNERDHEGFGCRSPHALGAGLTIKTAMTAYQCNGGSKEHRLDQTRGEVPKTHVALCVCPIVMSLDRIHSCADESAAHHAHEVSKYRQQRNQQYTGQESWHDKVMNRIDAETSEGINLFGDAHGGELGGDRAADSAGQHGGGEHWPELAHDRNVYDRAHP